MNNGDNRMTPSNWLRLQQMRMRLDACERYGASADMYHLPELPQELLDRLDSIEPEHLGPIAEAMGEMTTFENDRSRIEHYDSAPYRLYVELQEHEFRLESEFKGGASHFYLYTSKTKPNVAYLLQTDGDSFILVGTRFGHHTN
jgi:hypothetical protein